MEELRNALISDLKMIGADTEGFEIKLKSFSKCYFGRYKVDKKQIIVYVYEDAECTRLFPYKKLFRTVLHEYIHHVQWCDPTYIRCRGIMHDAEFHKLYHRYLGRYYRKCAERKLSTVREIR